MKFFRFAIFAAMALLPLPAHAHWGHVGELAGHGHVLGIGALAAAAALAAALAKPKRDENSSSVADEESEPAAEPEAA